MQNKMMDNRELFLQQIKEYEEIKMKKKKSRRSVEK